MATYQQHAAPPGGHQQSALPLFDLFLDLPHPAAAKSSPPPFILRSPATSAEMEQELNANLSRIGRFAFPEFDDATSQSIPRDTELNRFSQYSMQPKTFQHYTFSLQLQSGVRIHGHVRRFLPIHPGVKTRYDVGRRGERALVVLTRANGGDMVYSAILKTLDAILFQKEALEADLQPHGKQPEHWFLNRLFDQHRHMCIAFASLPQQDRKPMMLTVDSLEVGAKSIPLIEQADNSKFLIPTSLLTPYSTIVESVTSSSILPLLRVLGVQSTLRLLSALLSESRILLLSCSPTRLAQCARSALSILAQGLLHWQHLYIPVLPPHLFQYLAAPVPYLIGMLSTLRPRLDQARSDGLGEMVIIDLDTVQMETRGINPVDVAKKIPDLFRSAMAEQGMPVSSMSATEMLAQDLLELLKVDKRSLHGESALTNVSETAAKATQAVKSGLLKLKERGKNFLKNRSGSTVSTGSAGSEDEMDAGGPGGGDEGTGDPSTQNTLMPDFIYTQGAQNEVAEEEARIAFSSFFLSMVGNMRWYLSASPGQLPHLDRQRFLQQKRAMGEGEHTPIWPLLENFCQTQMLEEFAKARVEEVRTKLPVTSDSPLFTQCANHHRMHNIDFTVINVRRIARQIAQNNPSRIILQTQARRTAMLLTSNKTYEGDYNRAVAALVEQCRECSSVLFDVMSVIWVRLRDSKGLHWKHGFQALQILRNLLYHGPLSAIAEATDGLDKIRVMKFYNDNMRSQICTQMRQVAHQVYNLLVDRAKLYAIRRLCINKRRAMRKQDQMRYVKDTRMRVSTPFSAMHKGFNPSSSTMLAQIPSGIQVSRAQFAAEQDLLGFGAPAPAASAVAPPVISTDPFGFQSQNPRPSTGTNSGASSSVSDDLAAVFSANVAVSNPPLPAASPFESAPAVNAPNPFDSAPVATAAAAAINSVPSTAPVTNVFPAQQHPAQSGVTASPIPQYYHPQGQPAPYQTPPPQHYGGLNLVQPAPIQQPYGTSPAPPQAPTQQTYQQPYPMPGQPGYAPAPQPQSQSYIVQGQPSPVYPPAQQGLSAQPYQPQPPQQPYYPQQGVQQQQQPHPGYQQQQQGYPPAHPQAAPQKPNVSQFDPFK